MSSLHGTVVENSHRPLEKSLRQDTIVELDISKIVVHNCTSPRLEDKRSDTTNTNLEGRKPVCSNVKKPLPTLASSIAGPCRVVSSRVAKRKRTRNA
jgi:hypothetical protein